MTNSNDHKYPCIIPAVPEDFNRAKATLHYLFEFLPVSKIVFIGPSSLEPLVNETDDSDLTIEYINENSLVPFSKVKEVYDPILAAATTKAISTVNWYYQQFLKMAYANVCEEEYYLSWDADTIPVKKIEMFSENGKPYFDVKPEFNTSYFVTIERLFGYTKIIQDSFISEHMVFNKDFMLEMIAEIEKTSFEGEAFYEKILSAVGTDNLKLGFSEFETFGTFVAMRHQSAYMLRKWKSFRNANFFVDISDITPEDIKWLSRDYHAATFEKYHETEDILTGLFRDPHYREKLSPEQFYKAILESGAMGEYKDGKIKVGDSYFPI